MESADRSLNKMGKNAANTASGTAGTYGTAAGGIASNLIPGLETEAKTPIGYTPTQMASQLTAGEQGAGGAAGGVTGQANLEAARTRNAGGYGAALDEAQREKGRQLSQNALGVANKSADLGNKKQMFAQGELGNLYGVDTNAQMKALGIVPEDLNAATNADKTGWVQNFTDIMNSITGAAKAAYPKGMQG